MNQRSFPNSRKFTFIFERFCRRQGKAIIRCVTERHGEQIRVEGEPGNGSRFTLPWPLVLQEVPVKLNSHPIVRSNHK